MAAVPADTPLRVGEFLWTTRAGAEIDLIEELAQYNRPARQIQEAVVASTAGAARGRRGSSAGERGLEPAFARQGLPVQALCPPRGEALARVLAPKLVRPFALHLWVPDSDRTNPLSGLLPALQEALLAALPATVREHMVEDAPTALAAGGLLAQVCLLSPEQAAAGVVHAVDAHSLAPGGRLRFHVNSQAPSRSAMKLGEALAWLGRGPEPGEVCVDLGASPGGWTYVLHQRRAHVVAVDPGALAPSLRGVRGIEHLRMDAFRFAPDIAADWLFCDMAFRPLEVASLLAKWGRKHWARFLVANIKLPMRQRAAMLERVRDILATGGWTGLRVRQLYHDRDEVTVSAWRGFGSDAKPPSRR